MNVFIDTNIYLTFYHFSSDDLEELKKLTVAIQNGAINLKISDQIISEFTRNREPKIADALKKFKDQNLNNQFPQICKEYPEFKQLEQAVKLYVQSKNEVTKKLYADIQDNNLGADKVINDLFARVPVLKTDDDVLARAKTRISIGNPPGKNNSLGDAINWEILLSFMPDGEDLYLVSDDGDFKSHVNEIKLSQFLAQEWESKKKSKVYFYSKLSDFFREKFPQIKLASELKKELAISNLVKSSSFENTHSAIASLLGFINFADFSDEQVNELVQAAGENQQIAWIITDADVRWFYERLLKEKYDVVYPENLEKFKAVVEVNEMDIDRFSPEELQEIMAEMNSVEARDTV